MAALTDSAPAVQNISTAGVAGYVGGYLINLYNVGMLVAGTYAHRFIDVVQPDALVMSQDIKMGVAAAIGGYVLHRLQAADTTNRLSRAEREGLRAVLAQQPTGPTGAPGSASA
jgi:hypothetical protein